MVEAMTQKQIGAYLELSAYAKKHKALGVHEIWGLPRKSFDKQNDVYCLSDTDSDEDDISSPEKDHPVEKA